MKLEFTGAGAADCPLIRIYDIAPRAVASLQYLFEGLSSGDLESGELHALDGVEPIGGLRVSLRVGSDRGLIRQGARLDFEMTLSRVGWARVVELAQFFDEPRSGEYHQWLDETSNVSLLITSDPMGQW